MHIKKHTGYSPPKYFIAKWTEEGGVRKEELIVDCGHEKPTFDEPELYNGLCENYVDQIEPGSVDLLIDDPPYGTTQAQWDAEPDWDLLTELYGRVLAADGTLVVFGKQPSLIPVYNAFTNDGFEFRFELIWKKQNNPWVSDQQPIPIHENIFVFKKRGAKVGDLTFNTEAVKRDGVFVCPSCESKSGSECPECGSQVELDPKVNLGSYNLSRTNEGKSETQGGWDEVYEAVGDEQRHPISFIDRDVLEFTSVFGSHEEYMGYAGQKPTDLLSWLVMAMSKMGETVLDPHMGSGSTPAACIPLCRKSIGIEADKNRFEKAKERVGGLVKDLEGLKHAKVKSGTSTGSAD